MLLGNGEWRINFFHFLHSTLSTLRIFHTSRFLQSSLSTLHILYSPYFPQSVFSTLRTFHTRDFLQSSLSTLHILYSSYFPRSAFCTLLIFYAPHFPHLARRVFQRALHSLFKRQLCFADVHTFKNRWPRYLNIFSPTRLNNGTS